MVLTLFRSSKKFRRKILLITDIFPPKIGGPATFIARLAESIAERQDYAVTVICSSDKREDAADKTRAYTIHRLYQGNNLLHKLQNRLLLAKELLVHDAVLVNGLESFVYQVSRILHRSYILKIVGDSAWENARNTGETFLDIDEFQVNPQQQSQFAAYIRKRNRSLSFAKHVVTPSNYLKEIITGWGIEPEKITVVHNGIDTKRFADGYHLAKPDQYIQILFVGRLTNWKGIETLLLALSQISDAYLTVVGDGPEYPSLVSLSKQLKLEKRVTFTGKLSQIEVEEQMVQAHILVLTSLYEGMSHTILEAMALGLPCIVSNRGGNPELINSGINGILVEPQNVQELVNAITLLQSNEELRISISREARLRSRDFELEKMVGSYVFLLTQQAEIQRS